MDIKKRNKNLNLQQIPIFVPMQFTFGLQFYNIMSGQITKTPIILVVVTVAISFVNVTILYGTADN